MVCVWVIQRPRKGYDKRGLITNTNNPKPTCHQRRESIAKKAQLTHHPFLALVLVLVLYLPQSLSLTLELALVLLLYALGLAFVLLRPGLGLALALVL